MNPDAIAGELAANDRPGVDGPAGRHVPPGNRPGASSGPDQDKPDLDAMAAKFGIDEPDPDGERASEAAQQTAAAAFPENHSALAELTSPEMAETIKSLARVAGVALGVGVLIVRPIVRRIRRR